MSEQGILEFKRPKTSWRPPSELPELKDGEPIGFDFETKPGSSSGPVGIEDDAIAFAVWSPERQQGWYLPFGHRGGGNLDENMCKRWAKDQLANRDWYGLNAKYECHVARRWGLDFDEMHSNPHDVAFNAALLNENRYSGFSLESLIREYLPGEQKVRPSTVDPAKFYLASAGEVADRCIADARQAYEIHQATLPQLKKEELLDVLELENQCILPVADMEWNGAPIDRPKLERWVKESGEKINTTFMKIYNGLGFPVNPDTFEDMKKLFNARGVKIPVALDEDPETHEVTERETFAAPYIKDIKDEYVQAALSLRRTKSIKSKYLDKYQRAIDGNNILRYSLHQLRGNDYGTVTGRFSCGGGKHNVNIQQVMKCEKQIEDFGPDFIIRELFIPQAGAHLFSSDASQIEFRLFAHYSGSQRLITAYNEDAHVDFHQIVTDMIRIFVDIVRREAKHINFGKLYGMGLAKLCARLLLSEDDGRKLLSHYDEAFPEAGRLLRKAADLAKKRGYVKTLLGRRRRYPDGRRLHSALNAVIQGGAADVFKKKLRELYDARKQLEIVLRMPVHDEFVGDLLNLKKRTMLQECLDTQSFPLKVPLIWDTEVGADWRLGEGQAV